VGEILVLAGPPRLGLAELRERIAAYLKGTRVRRLKGTRVRRAVLFGSFARGDADFASDVDLLLIQPTSLPFVERGLAHRALFGLGVGLDLLVYTPEEYERLRDENNPLIARVEREGVTVYERSDG